MMQTQTSLYELLSSYPAFNAELPDDARAKFYESIEAIIATEVEQRLRQSRESTATEARLPSVVADMDLQTDSTLKSLDTLSITPEANQSYFEILHETLSKVNNIVIRLRKTDEGRIEYVMREGKMAKTFTTVEVYGKTPVEIFGEEVSKTTIPYVLMAFEGQEVQFEYCLEDRWFLTQLEPITSNGITKEVIGSMIDITEQKRVQAELKSSEQLFRMLLEYMPVGVFKQENSLIDDSIRNGIANPEFQKITGYSIEDFEHLTEQERAELFHPDDMQRVMDEWRNWGYAEGEQILHLQYRYKHRAGVYRWLENYLVKYPSTDKNYEVVLQVVTDITDRISSEQHLRHLASYLQQSVKPIFEMKRDGMITFMNPVCENTFPELSFIRLQHPILQGLEKLLDEIANSESKYFNRFINLGNEYYEQQVYFMPEVGVYRIFNHNVTPLKQAEMELRDALEKERSISLLRSRFINTISHEFRTPLTGISTSVAILSRYNEVMKTEQRMNEISNITKRVSELTTLIDNFTTQSSLRSLSEHFNPQHINFYEVCRMITEEVRSHATDKDQVIVFSSDKTSFDLIGDNRLLGHAIRNIMYNAVQYSHEAMTIQVELTEDESNYIFSVLDTGIGIPDEDIDQIGMPFFRGNNVGKIPGSGLGLSVAKEFVELHKGKIRLETALNVGTKVTVVLPKVSDIALVVHAT
jgi:PAS domain S-box-containing protein